MPSFAGSPRLLTVTVLVVALHAVVLVGFGLYLVVAGVAGSPSDRTGAVGAGALSLLGGAGLVLVARGLLRRRRWARSPALVAEVIVLPVAWGLVQGGRGEIGVPLLVTAAGCLVSLLAASRLGVLEG